MKEAFTYMFKDNKFWVKGLWYFGFVFIANLMINYAQTLVPPCLRCAPPMPWYYWVCALVGPLLSLIPLGYLYTCVKALIEQNDNYVLPNFNLWKNFLKGLKYAVALLMLTIPLLLISMIAVTISFARVYTLFLLIIPFALILCFAYFYIGFNWMFANKDSFITFYRFKKLFKLIGTNKKHYFMSFLVIAVVGLLNMLLEMACGATAAIFISGTVPGLIATGVSSAIIGTYTAFVICYLTAKSISSDLVETI